MPPIDARKRVAAVIVVRVLLASLLGVPLHTVLYLSSKNSTEERPDVAGFRMVAHPPLQDEKLACGSK